MDFLLQQVMLEPKRILTLDNDEIGQLLSQARCTRLLASLAIELQFAGLDTHFPSAINRHFESALLIHEKQKRDLAYDCEKIKMALDSIGEKMVLLKGAAYLLAELPVGRGRLITDIDIIVPRRQINEAEQALNKFGWESSHVGSYDDRYYRKWGHEIPPLTNAQRGTVLDVHHNILPPTAEAKVDASLLFDKLHEVKPGIFTLSLQDMVIHSATHLFHEGEFHHGLRDLWDLDRMLRDFPTRDPRFWDGLLARARALDLLGPLFHCLNYTQKVFATPLPQGMLEAAGNRWALLRKPLMDFLFLRAFRPDLPQCGLPFTKLALRLLYVRSHYLRMPLYLLLPHLVRKAWRRRFGNDDTSPADAASETV
jgi:hypothetical protein